jgi:hypothetical protein
MLPKSVIACLAASAFATGALIPTGASAVKGGPTPGTWNWPPYAGSGGGMARKAYYAAICGKSPIVISRANGFTSVIRSRSCFGRSVWGAGYREEARTASTSLAMFGGYAPDLVKNSAGTLLIPVPISPPKMDGIEPFVRTKRSSRCFRPKVKKSRFMRTSPMRASLTTSSNPAPLIRCLWAKMDTEPWSGCRARSSSVSPVEGDAEWPVG